METLLPCGYAGYCGNKAYKDIFLKAHGISQVGCSYGKNMNIAVFTVVNGTAGVLSVPAIPEEMINTQKYRAVGEVCKNLRRLTKRADAPIRFLA